MAAAPAASGLSKAEYLRRRYLEADADESSKKRRRKKKAEKEALAGRMRIVDDDDVSWKVMPAEQEKEEEGDEADLPVVAEFIDERPDEVKWMETFRASNKWKLLGEGIQALLAYKAPSKLKLQYFFKDLWKKTTEPSDMVNMSSLFMVRSEELQSLKLSAITSSSETSTQNTKKRLLALSSAERGCHSSPDQSPARQGCHVLPDLSPKRLPSAAGRNSIRSRSRGQCELLSREHSASRKKAALDGLLPRNRTSSDEGDLWLPQKLQPSRTDCPVQPTASSPRKRQRHDSESSADSPPPRRNAKAASDSDLSPPRASAHGGTQRPDSPLDLSPLRRRNRHRSSDSDLSPPRRGPEGEEKGCKSGRPTNALPRHHPSDITGVSERMLSGGSAGLVSAESLRREKQDGSSSSKHLEAESQHAKTVFRDETGRKRDLKRERLDQARRAKEQSERDEQFAKWGRGLAQSRQQQQNVEDAMKEMQKPLARYIHDQDLDRMLREQERDGDPMADFLKKKKATQGAKEKPKYKGPAPPLNRFNIWPGYRWDGVDRSNGFEQKRFARISSRKAVQELAYKWSVEDM